MVTRKFGRVGLLAVYAEAPALLAHLSVADVETALQAKFYHGTLGGQAVMLATVGPGKVQAAAAVQYLITAGGVHAVICCGSAGALAEGLAVGDVLLPDEVLAHDAGIHQAAGFSHLGFFNSAAPDGLAYRYSLKPDSGLLTLARQSAAAIEWPASRPAVYGGRLVSGDQIIAGARMKSWLHGTFAAQAVEMESAAVAQVAHANNIPWLVVRAISDAADSTIDVELPTLVSYQPPPQNLAGRLRLLARRAAHLGRRPARLLALYRLRKGIDRAAANAALITAAVVKKMAVI